MSTGLLDSPTDLLGNGDLSPEIIDLARRLHARAVGRQLSPYRQQILARLRAPNQRKLPDFEYQSYRLLAGTHTHATKEALAASVAMSKTQPGRDPVSPEERTYRPGDVITPQSDGEALMMDQNPEKFQPAGTTPHGGANGDVAALMAEVNRMKLEREADQARLLELEKANADLQEKAKTKK